MGIKLPFKALKHVKEEREGECLCTFEHPITKKEKELLLPVDYKEVENWMNGTLIQNAMPNLTADERELFLTGGLFDEL